MFVRVGVELLDVGQIFRFFGEVRLVLDFLGQNTMLS
jgi:hypothetical protein